MQLPWDVEKEDDVNQATQQKKIASLKRMAKKAEGEWLGYITWGQEYAPTTNKAHLQGYLQTLQKKTKRITALRKWCGGSKKKPKITKGIHWEIQQAKASNGKTPCELARDYCWKDGEGIWELGEFNAGGAGKRNDIHSAVDCLREAKGDMRALLGEHAEFIMRYPAGCKTLAQMFEEMSIPRYRDVKVYVFHGPTKAGKTWTATDGETHTDVCTIKGHSFKGKEWWPLYHGEKRLVIDDIEPSHLSIDHLMTLMDRERIGCPVKGGHKYSAWTELFLTTNKRWPEDWYTGAYPRKREALFGRVTRPK